MPNEQPNGISIESRLEIVENMLLCQHTRAEIVKEMNDVYGVAVRTTDRDIARVRERWKEYFFENSENRIFEHITKLENLYKLSLKAKDFRTCMHIRVEIAKIDGSYNNLAQSEALLTELKAILEADE